MEAYLVMFVNYCKQNDIWFAVCGDGSVDEVTDTKRGETVEPSATYEFGSLAAYQWLVRWHTALKIATVITGEPK